MPLLFEKADKVGLPQDPLINFYCCTVESVLTFCITAWYREKALQQVTKSPKTQLGHSCRPLRTLTCPDVTVGPQSSPETPLILHTISLTRYPLAGDTGLYTHTHPEWKKAVCLELHLNPHPNSHTLITKALYLKNWPVYWLRTVFHIFLFIHHALTILEVLKALELCGRQV